MAKAVGVTAYGQSNDPMQSLGLGALFLVVIGSLKKYCKLLLFFFFKVFFFPVETRSYCIAQASFKHTGLSNPPASASSIGVLLHLA